MPTQKRQRKKSTRQARQAAYEARRQATGRRTGVVAAVLVGVLVLGVAAIVGGGGGGGDDETDVDSTATTLEASSLSVPPGAALTGETPCPAADGSSPRTTSFAKIPPMCIDPAKTYTADIKTNKGTFTVALDPKAAPFTVNNFVVLSRYHFYDGIAFHRVVPGFVVQGGDVERGDGRGGPGYNLPDEFPQAGDYEIGSVAMANTGQPGSGGSQFFVITGPQGVSLPPSYSLFGKVVAGLDVVKRIEADGSPDPDPPKVVHRITKITIVEA